jgi:hypothetical protein
MRGKRMRDTLEKVDKRHESKKKALRKTDKREENEKSTGKGRQ